MAMTSDVISIFQDAREIHSSALDWHKAILETQQRKPGALLSELLMR